MLTVGVLGEVEVRRDGVRVDVPAGKTTELLARLALEAGSRVRADALIEDLWAGPTGRNTLQSKVSQLRRALGAKELVLGTGEGYTLAVEAGAVDATRATELARQAAEARSAHDAAGALERAGAGLDLFRGEVLVDAGDWAHAHRARLEEVRLGLVEDAMAARVELGAAGEIVAELEALVDRHPLREGLWASLITVLYRAGRQADALAAYARVRSQLVEELGIEPGAALRSLEQQVLQQSLALEPGPTSLRADLPGNLPAATSPLVGRAEDLAAVAAALEEHRLVTVVGLAGVGKTRLAIEVGRGLHAPGGVWLVRLDAVDATAPVRQVVAETLDVPGGEQGLPERLTGADTVLLLDNCEHLIGPVAVLARSLLAAVPRLRILATSQVSLGTEEECLHELGPLTQEDSVALFTRRAQEMRRQLVLDEDASAAVVEVCQALEGLPLAIELAASRARSLSVQDIARRIDDRFVLLRDPNSQEPERRRALVGAIEWSYELLFPDDQRGLWALSCFAGDASLDATEHVLTVLGVPSGSVLDTISRLVDRSLVNVGSTEGGAVRYRLLDSIKAYAADRLGESGHADTAGAAHAGWYSETADWCDQHIRSDRQPECLEIARAERANVDVALAWCATNDPLLGVRIANGFGWTWVVLGDGAAGAARVRGSLTATTPDQERATALLLAGWLEASAGDVGLAQADLDGARAVAEALTDEVLTADVHRHQAFLAIQQGRAGLVLESSAAALTTYRRLDLGWHTAASLLLAAYGALMLGDTPAATRDASDATDLLAPIGDSWGMVHAEAMLGGIAQAEHRFRDAARALSRAAEESGRLGFPGQAALHRATLARVLARLGDPAAAASYERAIQDAASVGDGRLAATARLNLARLLRGHGGHGGDGGHGVHEAVVELLEENERWYRSAGGGDFALLSRCVLCAERDDSDGLDDVLDEARATDDTEVMLFAIDALARLAAQSGRVAATRVLLAGADTLASALAHAVDESDRVDARAARRLVPAS